MWLGGGRGGRGGPLDCWLLGKALWLSNGFGLELRYGLGGRVLFCLLLLKLSQLLRTKVGQDLGVVLLLLVQGEQCRLWRGGCLVVVLVAWSLELVISSG